MYEYMNTDNLERGVKRSDFASLEVSPVIAELKLLTSLSLSKERSRQLAQPRRSLLLFALLPDLSPIK